MKTQELSKEVQNYPTQICLETEKGRFFLNKDGKRYKIPSDEIYRSWNFPLTVKTTEAACANYPTAYSTLGFRDGTLVFNIKTARIYLVSDGVLRQIVDTKSLKKLGLTYDSAMVVSNSDINSMKQGEDFI